MSNARQAAITAVTNYKSTATGFNFRDLPSGQIYGSNVFNIEAMKARVASSSCLSPARWGTYRSLS